MLGMQEYIDKCPKFFRSVLKDFSTVIINLLNSFFLNRCSTKLCLYDKKIYDIDFGLQDRKTSVFIFDLWIAGANSLQMISSFYRLFKKQVSLYILAIVLFSSQVSKTYFNFI
ncbi:MAG: hypothetical protein GAK29_04388 [Acinetobacter bereziniae]|uniref:Uncharacterized protein n=1 Tax=Acinetobacter bereziniae TaxID=106648 RepID=A0A833PBA9_ACIBZ|nr:MAG: hypothetical protein GAK29_04388 [Acinetobacter bereziniae]